MATVLRIISSSCLVILLTVLTSEQTVVSAGSQQIPIPSDSNINSKAKRATAIARVKYIRLQGGSKYSWEIVQILETIKNTSNQKLQGKVSIAHYSHKPGIPTGESTVYLEPYSDQPNSGWKLLSE